MRRRHVWSIFVLASSFAACGGELASTDDATGTAVSALGTQSDQSFEGPTTWATARAMGGWGREHPRLLADVDGDKRKDILYGSSSIDPNSSSCARNTFEFDACASCPAGYQQTASYQASFCHGYPLLHCKQQ